MPVKLIRYLSNVSNCFILSTKIVLHNSYRYQNDISFHKFHKLIYVYGWILQEVDVLVHTKVLRDFRKVRRGSKNVLRIILTPGCHHLISLMRALAPDYLAV